MDYLAVLLVEAVETVDRRHEEEEVAPATCGAGC